MDAEDAGWGLFTIENDRLIRHILSLRKSPSTQPTPPRPLSPIDTISTTLSTSSNYGNYGNYGTSTNASTTGTDSQSQSVQLQSLDPSRALYRVSHINHQFQLCPTYPERLVVPAAIDDQTLMEAAKFRAAGRFPVICYVHSNGFVCEF